ncbi:putative metal-binding motif-containing protein [Flagellimonas nanhaiensis]|uniref:Uncharacterized protein n=1 Tax=Flagellimonas nanhaiensis TaxID=2292706 RepID=A0A371JUD8_9FLAO|nr:putative metal-binding motif-containing protein [Allomuricauda nanhaiensis]RDY61431.1 hypothetical protein DX873_04525 [Allomuricauda nanhaiensis]
MNTHKDFSLPRPRLFNTVIFSGLNSLSKLTLTILSLLILISCGKDKDCTEKTYYADTDGDGFGNPKVFKSECSEPTGYVTDSSDPDDSNKHIFPDCEQVTYYADEDGDGFGNPQNSQTLCSGQTKPEGYVTDNTDCNDVDPNQNPNIMVTYYADTDGDDFGNPNESQTISICDIIPEGYVLDNTDCDDTNATVFPGATEIPNDGIDSDCDGTIENVIWTGPDLVFSKVAFADWTDPANQDRLTDSVVFTRQNSGSMYNYQWWQDTFGEDAIHINSESSDLSADFWADDIEAIKDIQTINPSGGTKGVRWALLDATGADTPNPAWDDFPLYGTLGDPTHFYSFHNIATIIRRLNDGILIDTVLDDFIVGDGYNEVVMDQLVGKKLGVWLVEEDIYLTLTFTEWGKGQGNPGGTISYTRSTPQNQ